MPNYKLAAFDMDGTLLNSRKEIPSSAVLACKRAAAAGRIVALDTGRAVTELTIFPLTEMGIRYGSCACGTVIYDFEDSLVLAKKTIPESLVPTIVEASGLEDLMLQVMVDGISYGGGRKADGAFSDGRLPAALRSDYLLRRRCSGIRLGTCRRNQQDEPGGHYPASHLFRWISHSRRQPRWRSLRRASPRAPDWQTFARSSVFPSRKPLESATPSMMSLCWRWRAWAWPWATPTRHSEQRTLSSATMTTTELRRS